MPTFLQLYHLYTITVYKNSFMRISIKETFDSFWPIHFVFNVITIIRIIVGNLLYRV